MNAPQSDIIQCQFSNWYTLLVGKTFKSRVIPLPVEFITYLGEDGVILPKSSKSYFNNDVLSDDEDDNTQEVGNDEDCLACAHDFSELDAAISEAIQELQGEVMVKLNWSSPLDAIWANAGSLKCRSASDIYLLLKASDRVTFDLEKMFDLCSDDGPVTNALCNAEPQYTLPTDQYTLVLRKWANLNPAMEFRVFIRNRSIIGISQRDCCTYYDFLEAKVDDLQDHIYDFFYGTPDNAKQSLTSVGVRELFPLENYVMDVYVDLKNRVWLVDFNPFGEPTCALLFEWEELFALPEVKTINEVSATAPTTETQLCEFRIIESAAEVLQSSKGSSRGPIDVHAATEFRSFMDICKAQQAEDSDSDDSNTD
eukprot:CAMPEP_0184973386 /NCGR_PEP_ID=MMETSP1098-20130426/5193_1 /TAXON_ID=89044 /ORGANISM="Spumella elongata, Strain CCAP 955/1" /LENGTH=367 /DNA_ID=CAMNT_0027495839 /DNA_START=27 /DNA_END=1130 /DNA_ORIENTATION=-